jgi:hypothetical protein
VNKVAIIHFYPPELYPPLQNLLTEMSKREDLSVLLLTNQVVNDDLSVFETGSSKVKIVRIARVSSGQASLVRYWNYFLFYLTALWRLGLFAPRSVLYFETLSSFPALVYYRFFKKIKLYIHYHEYTSEQEYQAGMVLNRFFHRWEKKIYSKAAWVSHTNHFRMSLFEKDIYPQQLSGNGHLLPNYPPERWRSQSKQFMHDPLLVVYAGAFSLDTMYVVEFAHWVVAQQGKVRWDIYSYNLTTQARHFIRDLHCPWIQLQPGVDYEDLPLILKKYDVGLILYRGHILNYIYNAPNKLFEYLACGIDVWFPHVMTGAKEYATQTTYPKVIPIDFAHLNEMDLGGMISREGLVLSESNYFYECVLEELIRNMIGNDQ